MGISYVLFVRNVNFESGQYEYFNYVCELWRVRKLQGMCKLWTIYELWKDISFEECEKSEKSVSYKKCLNNYQCVNNEEFV